MREIISSTTIKRWLSRIGIGNPLNMLFYTNAEIETMRKRGRMYDPKKNVKKEKWSREPFDISEQAWYYETSNGLIFVIEDAKTKEVAQELITWGNLRKISRKYSTLLKQSSKNE